MPAPDVRVSVYSPSMSSCFVRDAAATDMLGGQVQYEDTPGGGGAGSLSLGITYEQVISRGYWAELNIVEISTGDDVLQQAFTTNTAPASDTLVVASWNKTTYTRAALGGPGGAAALNFAGTGSPDTTGAIQNTAPITVTPGLTYVFSAYITASKIVSGPPALRIYNSTGSTILQQSLITLNGDRRYSITWTCPVGTTSVLLNLSNVSTVVASGNTLSFSQPMFEQRASASPWYVSSANARVYVGATQPYDPALGEDTQQIYLWDLATLTMGIPVTSVGTDAVSGQPYLNIGTPNTAMPGNPSTIKTYAAGTTVGRRRYAGIVRAVERPNQKIPAATVTLGPVSSAFDEVQSGYTVGAASNTDVTTAIYNFISTFANRWPHLTISASNFTALTGCLFQGSRTTASVGQMITDALQAISGAATTTTASTTAGSNTAFNVTAGTGTIFGVGATIIIDSGTAQEGCVITAVAANTITVASTTLAHASGIQIVAAGADDWFVRIGHDRTPRMIRVYVGASNVYTYPITLTQGTTAFEPLSVDIRDNDCSTYYNAIQVIGNTNTATQQPYSAIVVDNAAVALIGRQIDGSPVTNTSLNSTLACATYAQSLLNQFSQGQLQGTFRVYTRNDQSPDVLPLGIANGDVIRGVNCVTVAGFQGTAPNVYGLSSSVVTTIDINQGDRWQDVTFNPIEPDWNAAMALRANAVATALQGNVSAGSGAGTYSISTDGAAATFSGSSLVLSIPAFIAVFGSWNSVESIAAKNLTVPASAVSYIFLSPAGSGTWTTQSSAAPLAGDILYGMVQASATGILGFTLLAPVDGLRIGVGQINFGNHPTPTASASSLAAGFTDNSVHAQVNASVTLTNVTTDPTITGIAYYYALHGSTDANKFKPVGEVQLLQSGGATQTAQLGFEIGAGQSIDVYVGYVGIGSSDYGPLLQIGSTAQISSGFTPAALVVTTPYMAKNGTVAAPSVSAVTFTAVASANGLSGGMKIAWTVSNQPTDGSLSRLALYRRVTGSGTLYEKLTDVPATGIPTPVASQAYVYTASDLSNGQSYDWAVAYEDAQGGEAPAVPTAGSETRFGTSSVGYIGSSPAATVIINTSSLPLAPVGGTFACTAFGVTSYIGAGGSATDAVIAFTTTYTPPSGDSRAFSVWGSGGVYWAKVNNSGASDGDLNVANYHQIGTFSGTSVPTGDTVGPLGAGNAYQIGLQLIDQQGKPGPFVILGLTVAQLISPPGTIAGSSATNLIVDPQFTQAPGVTTATAVNPSAWTGFGLAPGVSNDAFGIFAANSGPGGNGGGGIIPVNHLGVSTGSGGTMSAIGLYSDVINVSAGLPYIATVSWSTNHIITGDFHIAICNVSDKAANAAPASIVLANGTSGAPCTALLDSTPTTSATGNTTSTPVYTPAADGQIVVCLYANSVKANFGWYNPQFEQGTQYSGFKPGPTMQTAGTLAYASHSAAFQAVISPSGTVPSSTPLKPQASIPPQATPGVSISASNSSGTCSTTISWSAGTISFPDGSTASISAGSHVDSGATSASTTYHYSVYATVSGTTATVVVVGNYGANQAPNQTQKFAVYLDGRSAITEDTYVTTPASSGGSPTGGGGGGGTSCPSVDQLVLTKERGYIRAGDYAAGMHLMGPKGAWVRILKVEIETNDIIAVTVGGERIEVDTNHYWQRADGEFMRVTELSMNTLLAGADGNAYAVEAIEKIGPKQYAKTKVEGGVFMIGQLVGHNIVTL